MNSGILSYESSFLFSLAWELKEGARAVNIGGGSGISSLAILAATGKLKDFKMWSIDIEDCQDERHLAERFQLHRRLVQIQSPSDFIGREWNNGKVDLLFVDGSHSYEGVYSDLEAWTPHLKDGGIVCCHDYKDPRQTEVTRAINEWHKKNKKDYYKLGSMIYVVAFLKKGGDTEWTWNRINLPWEKSLSQE